MGYLTTAHHKLLDVKHSLCYLCFVNVVFTGERRLIETVAVSQLKGTRLGVDGNYWLRKILVKEPSLTAMGGTPFTLQHAIEKELEHFKQVILLY
jgi:hypothetical protein